ncbi:MAG TPA: HD domain-containing phosphohydrolase [Noviherbaspirillum sp.]|uniref:GAF and HD-GYP domain-containing protein n=1 Tax=Noviherbaspirillum sp. TaxID=1926288 RepID=UPI002D4B142B|nr:HD domain-containing phosphohydrolase [Noviherbaspirillum sp.]HYD94078.1 HD domain-containing phosphohydrolase [Noviherbaspirillum sp.]
MSDPSYTDIAQRLERLTELSVELSTNHDIPLLLEKILKAAKGITHADGGTLYRASDDKQRLCFNISINDTLGMYQGGASGHTIDIPDIPLVNVDGSKNLSAVAAYAANTGTSVNIQDVYKVDLFNFSGMRRFDERYNYHSQSFLTVPMTDHEGEVIGVLQLINAKDPATGHTRAFSDTDQRFIEALASQAAIAITNQQLILLLENLFESFVKLINIGIDEKSPHTGRHCEHVPELTMMLADAVHDADSGPLASFRMTPGDRKQLWIAGLLHDCGKITTPVHVVEKATKLEALFDRIHLVDARFEVLKRDAEIRALKAKLAAGNDTKRHEEINRGLSAELARLDDDREFLRFANIGSEAMSPEAQARVTEIARYRWTGPDGFERDLLSEDEIANLTIRAGTLNAQEREIINNHIAVTIRMLESLPWPKHLQAVPEYAGGHHERMDGKGYPRGLRGDQMSVQARMMAIADIFEALTAKDRPYKKGKTLSESLEILGGFCERSHIDPDLFDIFVRKKVYLQYAERFMDPSQIDEVDESRIPGYVP